MKNLCLLKWSFPFRSKVQRKRVGSLDWNIFHRLLLFYTVQKMKGVSIETTLFRLHSGVISPNNSWYPGWISLKAATVWIFSVKIVINKPISVQDDWFTVHIFLFHSFSEILIGLQLPKVLYTYDASLYFNYFFPQLPASFLHLDVKRQVLNFE